MLKTLMENIVRPTLTRVGSVAAGALIQYGIATEHANAIAFGGVALCLVAIDWGTSYLNRKASERAAVRKAVANVL